MKYCICFTVNIILQTREHLQLWGAINSLPLVKPWHPSHMVLCNRKLIKSGSALLNQLQTESWGEQTYFGILLLIPIFILQGLKEMKTVQTPEGHWVTIDNPPVFYPQLEFPIKVYLSLISALSWWNAWGGSHSSSGSCLQRQQLVRWQPGGGGWGGVP